MHRALQLVQQNWISDHAVRDELVQQLESAEDASKQVIQLLGEMVQEKHD